MSAKFKKYRLFWGAPWLLILTLSQIARAVENCDYANDLLFYAYHLHSQERALSQQQLLFSQSLQFCPNQPKIHYILATILKQKGQYSKAIKHYKQTLKLYPDYYQTWSGLGEAYYKQERFPLSVEAYSYTCQINPDSKAQIRKMFRNKRLAATDKGKIIAQDSLLVLYDMKRRDALNQRLLNCGITTKVQPIHTFFNLAFDSTITSLHAEIKKHQLDEIAAALQNSLFSQVVIHGHTDARGFRNLSVAESKQRNLRLSLERAAAIAVAFVQRGIDKKVLQAYGHGSRRPIIPGTSREALAKNRRIEIEVQPVVTSPYQENTEGDK
jgi:outer membrane protein OmpA-like peptidoglycan-associated protein